MKLYRFGTSLKISLEPVKTGLEPVKTGLFQQKICLKISFLGFKALHPLNWPKKFLVLKKNPYLVNLVPKKVESSTCSKKHLATLF